MVLSKGRLRLGMVTPIGDERLEPNPFAPIDAALDHPSALCVSRCLALNERSLLFDYLLEKLATDSHSGRCSQIDMA